MHALNIPQSIKVVPAPQQKIPVMGIDLLKLRYV